MDVFEKQDFFMSQMLNAYKSGVIHNPVYETYFNWKSGKIHFEDLTKEEVIKMRDAAEEELNPYYDKYEGASLPFGSENVDDIWHSYRIYKEDAYIVSYLEAIDAELTNLLYSQVLQ